MGWSSPMASEPFDHGTYVIIQNATKQHLSTVSILTLPRIQVHIMKEIVMMTSTSTPYTYKPFLTTQIRKFRTNWLFKHLFKIVLQPVWWDYSPKRGRIAITMLLLLNILKLLQIHTYIVDYFPHTNRVGKKKKLQNSQIRKISDNFKG